MVSSYLQLKPTALIHEVSDLRLKLHDKRIHENYLKTQSANTFRPSVVPVQQSYKCNSWNQNAFRERTLER